MADADLDRLEALAAAATPGPWTNESRRPIGGPCFMVRAPGRWRGFSLSETNGALPADAVGRADGLATAEQRLADATFIAATRGAVPALVAEVRRLRAELAEARQRCEGLAERVAAQSEILSRRAERPVE